MNTARPLVIGNWKMNLDYVEALHLTQQLGVMLRRHPLEHTDVVLCPPFVDLRSVSSVIDADRLSVALGAQHVNDHESGAFTGEVSISMLKRLNVQWVLVGHSERREHFAMDNAVVASTLTSVLASNQHAVLCVGESLTVREANDHEAFVEAQLRSALSGVDASLHPLLTIAYEPLWAIGTGVNASVEQVRAMSDFLRRALTALAVAQPQVLYGGSVNAENAASLIADGGVDGFLVGGASLKAETFFAILRACDDCYAIKR